MLLFSNFFLFRFWSINPTSSISTGRIQWRRGFWGTLYALIPDIGGYKRCRLIDRPTHQDSVALSDQLLVVPSLSTVLDVVTQLNVRCPRTNPPSIEPWKHRGSSLYWAQCFVEDRTSMGHGTNFKDSVLDTPRFLSFLDKIWWV